MNTFAEVRNKETNKWELVDKVFPDSAYDDDGNSVDTTTAEPFNWRSYSMYGFLAGQRNWSNSPTLADKVKSMPTDSEHLNEVSPYAYNTNPMNGEDIPVHERDTIRYDLLERGWGHGCLYLRDLIEFDYDTKFEDVQGVQVTPNFYDGSAQKPAGTGEMTTVREFLGQWFFKHLETLQSLGEPDDVRIIFYFN